MGCHFLLQGIFLTQGSNPGLPHCRQTLYRLSHQGCRGWLLLNIQRQPLMDLSGIQSSLLLSCEIMGVVNRLFGEGNGTPVQYSCLENPMDRGAWKAAVHGVPEGRTQLHFHFSLSCIGEGNGNPLQCSCLENPRDGGAWWAAIYGVAQSRTRLKRLSSSSNRQLNMWVWLLLRGEIRFRDVRLEG